MAGLRFFSVDYKNRGEARPPLFLHREVRMDWFKFHMVWSDGIQELSDAEAGRFIKAICEYVETGKTEAQSGNERFMYAMALRQLKQDAERSAKISSVRAEAGRAGGLSKQTEANKTNASNCLQTENAESNCSIKNKNKEIRNKNKNKETDKEHLTAVAVEVEQRKPIDWHRAFGPESDRAERFASITGITPLRTEYGRWQKELRQFTEADISIDVMVRAVDEMKKKGLTIGAPGSCFKIARDLSVKQAVPTTDYLAGITWEGMDE